jgi:hypothetical protein
MQNIWRYAIVYLRFSVLRHGLKKFGAYGPPIVVNCDISPRNMDGQAYYPMYIDFMNFVQIFNTSTEPRHEIILVKNTPIKLTSFNMEMW